MAFKPVHIQTNDDSFLVRLLENGLEFEIGAEDYTEAEGLHYHYLVYWPIGHHRRLTPSRQGAVRAFRRQLRGGFACDTCWNQGYNRPCQDCGLYYKFIWCAGPDHTDNTRRYIQRKPPTLPDWVTEVLRAA